MDDVMRWCEAVLKAARIEHGLVIDFGSYKSEIQKHAMTDAVRPAGMSRLMSILLRFCAFFRGYQ